MPKRSKRTPALEPARRPPREAEPGHACRGGTHPGSTLRAAGRKGPSVRRERRGPPAARGFLPAVPARSQVLDRGRPGSRARPLQPAGSRDRSGRLGWVPGPRPGLALRRRAPRAPPTHPAGRPGPPLTFCESMARD